MNCSVCWCDPNKRRITEVLRGLIGYTDETGERKIKRGGPIFRQHCRCPCHDATQEKDTE